MRVHRSVFWALGEVLGGGRSERGAALVSRVPNDDSDVVIFGEREGFGDVGWLADIDCIVDVVP